MTTTVPPVLPDARAETLRILLLVQAAVFATSLFEAAVASIAFPGPVGVVGTSIAVVALLFFVRSAGRGRIPRALPWFERSLIVWFFVDSALSVGLAHTPLELVPTLTRLILPFVILRMVKGLRS